MDHRLIFKPTKITQACTLYSVTLSHETGVSAVVDLLSYFGTFLVGLFFTTNYTDTFRIKELTGCYIVVIYLLLSVNVGIFYS